jgi:hypothetical protein
MELKQPIPPQKYTMSEDLGESETLLLQSPYAPTIIALEIPVITRLGLKSLLLIGGFHQRNSLRKLGIY